MDKVLRKPALLSQMSITFGHAKRPMSAIVHSVRSGMPNALPKNPLHSSVAESGARSVSTDFGWQASRERNEAEKWKEQVQSDVSKKLPAIPLPKFAAIERIPDGVKNMMIEEVSISLIKDGFLSLFNPATIARNRELLSRELISGGNKGDEDSMAILGLIKDVATGKVTHAHITDGIPPIEISGFKPSALRDVMHSIVSVDNDLTSKDDTYATALRYSPSTLFTYALFNLISKANYPLPLTPINCFRTTHAESVHSQGGNFRGRASASALVGISADGSIVTYVVDAEQIVSFLDEDEIRLLMQPKFYHPESVFGTASPSKEYPILEKIAGRCYIRLENAAFISSDLGMEGYQKYNLILEKINHAVAVLLQEGRVTEMPIKTGEYGLMDNSKAVWGRHAEGQNSIGKTSNGVDGKVELETPKGKERKIMNVNAAVQVSPLVQGAVVAKLNSPNKQTQLR